MLWIRYLFCELRRKCCVVIAVTDSQKLKPSRSRRSRLSEHRRNLAEKSCEKLTNHHIRPFVKLPPSRWNRRRSLRGVYTPPSVVAKTQAKARVHWRSLYVKTSATAAHDRHYCTCLGNLTQIGSFLSVLRHPRWPRQVQYWLSRVTVTGNFALKTLSMETWLNRTAHIWHSKLPQMSN